LPSTSPTSQEQFGLTEDLILVVKKQPQRRGLNKLAGLLGKYGYVKESFYQALLEREEAYPTGLQTSVIGVAIPHTDTGHVIKPPLAIATLEAPVFFQAMDNPQSKIPVELIIVMAIKEPAMQLKSLQKIMQILQDENILIKINIERKARQANGAGSLLAMAVCFSYVSSANRYKHDHAGPWLDQYPKC
jgi:PTS system galactitol-specific IIA component